MAAPVALGRIWPGEMTPAARWLVGGTVAIGLLGAGTLLWLNVGADTTDTDPARPSLATRGKTVYVQHCASCHGGKLEGQPNWRERLPNGRLPAPPHDGTGHTWHHSDKQLFDMVKDGTAGSVPGYETDMPTYRDILSDADIWAVLSFIESTWPPKIRELQKRISERSH